jgi:putative lipoic acid-binding regulatory protein
VFPGEYVIKAFGPSGGTFEADAEACATGVLGEDRVAAHTKFSSGGRRSCVTLTLRANTVDEVIATYERLHELEALMLIL